MNARATGVGEAGAIAMDILRRRVEMTDFTTARISSGFVCKKCGTDFLIGLDADQIVEKTYEGIHPISCPICDGGDGFDVYFLVRKPAVVKRAPITLASSVVTNVDKEVMNVEEKIQSDMPIRMEDMYAEKSEKPSEEKW